MKEELQNKLVEVLTSMQSAVTKAGDFAAEQLPDIAQQYIAYGRIVEVPFAIFGWLTFAGFILMSWRLFKHAAEAGDEDSGFMGIFSLVGTGLAGLFAMTQSRDAILVYVAPKVWLLKEIAQLIK